MAAERYKLTAALRSPGSGVLFGSIVYLGMAVLGFRLRVFAAVAVIDLLHPYRIHTEQVPTFMTRHWHLNSALLAHAHATDRPAFGSEVPAVTDGQRAMREATLRHGYRCAVAFPRRLPPDTPAGSFGAVLLLGRADPPAGEAGARRHAALVRGLTATFIDRWAELIVAECARSVRLSAIEVRLLQCLAAGQTTAQAAAALGKNTTAVNNHYRRINAKLGVRSKRAALVRARAMGLLNDRAAGN